MKKVILVALLLIGMQTVYAQKKEKLFNGKDLTGWAVYGTEKWYVEKGLLVSESGPDKGYGYLGTIAEYDDFEVELEFKQEANGNSGVFIRSTVDGTKVSGWQVEVAPPGNDTGGIYESYGRGWLVKPDPEKDKALKFGEWNKMKIVVQGDRVISYVNGVEMVNYADEKIGAGKGGVLLQIQNGAGIRVYWRNIVLKKL